MLNAKLVTQLTTASGGYAWHKQCAPLMAALAVQHNAINLGVAAGGYTAAPAVHYASGTMVQWAAQWYYYA